MGARRVVALIPAVAGLLVGVLAPAPAARADDPTRIMIVGDSIPHGSTGDWTWRYRLWQHLGSASDVDFVGPRDDLFDMNTGAPGCYRYADPDFDTDHAALWGATLWNQVGQVAQLVTTYEPDVVVEALGTNDLLWWGFTPLGLKGRLSAFVDQARSADPGVDVVVADLPQEWYPGFAPVNEALEGWAEELDTPQSRVVAAQTDEFLRDVDTWDDLHPSATGEVKIAAGIADALAVLGVGDPYPRPLPQVSNGPSQPAVLSGAALDGYVELTWQNPAGATAEYVWVGDEGAGDSWQRLPMAVEGTTWRVEGLRNYSTYSFRLQAMKGTAVSEISSNTVALTPAPAAPPAPSGLTVVPRRHRLRVRWEAVSPATGYAVTWWRKGHKDEATTVRTAETTLLLQELAAGRTYRATVTALNDLVAGPSARAGGIPTGPTPRGPRRLTVTARSGRTFRLTWTPRRTATRYEVWHRSPRRSWHRLGWRQRTRFTTRPLVGKRHTFRIRSWHQGIGGGLSPKVKATR